MAQFEGSQQNGWLFEIQVSWKADFCLGTSGTLYPKTLGRFLFNLPCPSTFRPQGPPWKSWNWDDWKIAKYFSKGKTSLGGWLGQV